MKRTLNSHQYFQMNCVFLPLCGNSTDNIAVQIQIEVDKVLN
jgi:hypothetical protein